MNTTQFKSGLKLTILASSLVCGFSVNVHADSGKLINPDNNHAYQRFDALTTWANAKIVCSTKGGHLATITSQAENDWVWNSFGPSTPVVDYFGNHRAFWLGGTDKVVEGQWQWITGETWDYTNWSPVQPDNTNSGQDYLVMWDRDANGTLSLWDDGGLPNADNQIPYLCEWENSFLPPIIPLGDINHDNSPEIAVITYDPTRKKTTATVKSAQNGILVKQITFNGQFVPQKANTLIDLNANGAREIAVLGVRDSDQAVQVEVRDSLTGDRLSVVPFASEWPPIDLGIVRNFNGKGTVGLAVLQQNATGLQVQLKDALTGAQVRNVTFNAGYKGIDLVAIPDLNGNQSWELAVLGDNKTVTAADQVEIRDGSTGQLIRTLSYGTGKQPLQLLSISDMNASGGNELAVLRDGSPRVLVKDAKTGLAINTLDYTLTGPFRLATVDDSAGTNGLALLSKQRARAQVHDILTDTLINNVIYDNYGSTVGFISIADLNSNGVTELVRLREQPGPQKLFVEVRDGRTGVLIQGMYF